MDISSHLIPSPTDNSGVVFNEGVKDAAVNNFRRPVMSMRGAYYRGWLKVRPLPAGENWTGP